MPTSEAAPAGQPGQQGGQGQPDTGGPGRSGADSGQLGVAIPNGRDLGAGGPEGDELGGALGEVDHGRTQVAARRGEARLPAPGQGPGEPGHDGGGQHHGHGQDDRGARQHPPHNRHRHDTDHHRGTERGDDPDDQVLLGVDIPDDPGQEVAPPERRQAGGRKPLEALVDLHSEISEQPEGGIVADQPLAVAEEAAGQPEELHGDNGQGQSSLVGMLGRPGDEPRRGADECRYRRPPRRRPGGSPVPPDRRPVGADRGFGATGLLGGPRSSGRGGRVS